MSQLHGYTLEQAAILLSCSTRTVQRMVTAGTLKAIKLGTRSVRVPSSEITRLLTPVGGSVDVSARGPVGKVKLFHRVNA